MVRDALIAAGCLHREPRGSVHASCSCSRSHATYSSSSRGQARSRDLTVAVTMRRMLCSHVDASTSAVYDQSRGETCWWRLLEVAPIAVHSVATTPFFHACIVRR